MPDPYYLEKGVNIYQLPSLIKADLAYEPRNTARLLISTDMYQSLLYSAVAINRQSTSLGYFRSFLLMLSTLNTKEKEFDHHGRFLNNMFCLALAF